MKTLSPLRYPGGKSVLAPVLEQILYDNGLQGCTFVELYAGGAGAALSLLNDGHVDRIVINDADKTIFAFWKSSTKKPAALCAKIRSTDVSLSEWKKQRRIYLIGRRKSRLALGFAAFYLNRCNRSGIIKNGGPIGGIKQTGSWKLDARFNRLELAERIERIAEFGDRIIVLNEDGASLARRIRDVAGSGKVFVYADPPYFIKGRELYLNSFARSDHQILAETLKEIELPWVLTYDDVPETRALFPEQNLIPYSLRYTAHLESSKGGEILVASKNIAVSKQAKKMLRSVSMP